MTGLLITLTFFLVIGAAMTGLVGRTSWYLLGVGTSGFLLYVTLLAHVPPVATSILLFILGVLVLILRPIRLPDRAQVREWLHPAAGIAVIPFIAIFISTAIVPLHDFDGRAFWLLKAKVIATERQIDGPFFRGTGNYDPRNRYPLLVPLDDAVVMIASDDLDERQVRWIYPLALLALALHVRRWTGWWIAALLPWIPQFNVVDGGATSAYNDIFIAAFAGCAFFELVERESPLRFGLWLAFLTLTKSEGLPIALVLMAGGIVVFRRRIAVACVPFLLSIATLVAWRHGLPITDEEDFIRNLPRLSGNLHRAVPAMIRMVQHAMRLETWGLFWLVVLIAVFVLVVRRRWNVGGLPIYVLAAMSGVYVAAYVLTGWVMNDLIDASVDRLIMHLVVPALFLVGESYRTKSI